ncbi:MAG: DEAD/DEAH box helicase, partial [Bacteroidetes bacterium]
PQPLAFQPLPQLTPHQNAVLQKALEARDYFLLWGPPGTGKTNRLLKHLVEYLFRHSSQNILLLAYTNRAVDEICGALEEVLPEDSPGYLRIGSRYATAEPYRPRLLSLQLESIRTRKELRALIDGHRLVVGTLASFDNAREEMLALKKFDLVVIDEASQILEPQLVGLLTHFPKAILIGDHRQLPAVVQQAPHLTAIQDDQLKSIGLNDLADSLFERLFRRCRQQGWSQAFDILEEQGRMHRDLMEFPNRQFYDGILKTLPETLPTGLRQSAPLERSLPPDATALEKALASQRLLFLSTPIDLHSPTLKTNAHEARQVLHVLLALRRLFEASHQALDWSQVGIITPYRAQIALLKTTLAKAGLPADRLTIDTVERYQGGARDVIVLSLCTNALEQIDALVSLSSDGVDRKLNVALTRAREQLVVIGNAELLERNPSYAAFLAFLKEKGALCQTLSLEMNRETARP